MTYSRGRDFALSGGQQALVISFVANWLQVVEVLACRVQVFVLVPETDENSILCSRFLARQDPSGCCDPGVVTRRPF